MKQLSDMKVAIVCDWLTGTGGAERVVLELHKMFPKAPIYTSQYDPNPDIWYGDTWFHDADIRTLWLQKLPTKLKKFLPLLRARAFKKLDLSSYDLVISASGAEAKAVRTGPDTVHVSYLHAPTHYYWSRYEAYIQDPGFGALNWLARLSLKLLVGPLRKLDYQAAQRPDFLLANSTHIKAEIKKYYQRDATVIHPPVDTERFGKWKMENDEGICRGFVTAGRQTPYKRIDLAVAACTKLNLPLTVIGKGPDHAKLKSMAGPTVTFVTNAGDDEIAAYFAASEAFIFPGLDDFGITPVEAMAAGTPVIAYRAGGALDYVLPGVTGEFFDEQSVDSLVQTLQGFNAAKFSSGDIKRHAQAFSVAHFQQNIKNYLKDIIQQIKM